MTDKPTITQADRDAAYDLLGGTSPPGILTGREDTLSLIQALANHREAAIAELQAEVERLREALQMAAKQFRFYEESHLLKETTDGIAKAVANRRCAEQCEIALAQKEPVE